MRQSAAVNNDLPTWDPVPRTMTARAWFMGRLPGSRPFRTGLGSITKTRIDAGVHLDQPAEEPDKIREAIEIGQHLRLDRLPTFRQPHRTALGAAADGAGDLIGRGLGVRAGQ